MDNNPLDLNFENKGDLRGCLEAALQESFPNRGFPEARLAHRDPARQFLRRARKALISTTLPSSLYLPPACSHLVHIRMDGGGEMEEEEAEWVGGQPTEPFTLHAVC